MERLDIIPLLVFVIFAIINSILGNLTGNESEVTKKNELNLKTHE